MSDQSSSGAGVLNSGKEAERSLDELSSPVKTRMVRKQDLKAGNTTRPVSAPLPAEGQSEDEFFQDCLLRMGIQI